MDDALYGKRDKRGDWKPSKLIQYPPVFVWPAQPINHRQDARGSPERGVSPGYGQPVCGSWGVAPFPPTSAKPVAVWLAPTLLSKPAERHLPPSEANPLAG